MASILPDVTTGGAVVIRDATGAPTNPPDVHGAYVPSAAFISTCLLTALPETCEARIEPKQINAIVSELLAFAECLDPNGPWDCNSLTNICNAFTTWAAGALVSPIHISDTPPVGAKDNDLWWESDTATLFILYNDGDTTQWVQVSGAIMDNVSIIGAGTIANPHHVGTIDCGSF